MANQNQNQSQNQNQNQRKQREDFSLKETRPNINAGWVISGDRLPTTFDLVEQMQFLFARVVRAKDLPEIGDSEPCNSFVEVRLGNFIGTTRVFEKTSNPEWNQVFAFSKERIQEQVLEVVVMGKKVDADDLKTILIGRVMITISDVPMRVPPDSPLAPQWYKLEDQNGVKLVQGELMVSVWMGTQADEGFPDAWHSDATPTSVENITYTRSKVYISPRLWYLRVNMIQGQDLWLKNKGKNSEILIQGVLGNLTLRSRSMKANPNPLWNEDLMFVAAEPFDGSLILSIEQGQGNSSKHEKLGFCVIHLKDVERILDATHVPNVWYNLQKPKGLEESKEKVNFNNKINLRISLDGGYHVLDEATHYSSDLRPSCMQLWKPSIGVLELGILNAVGLSPMKKDRTDAYCVAKYGLKWVRTRTIIDSFSPKWNEQYTWEVFDPCTVITIVVFDNGYILGGKNAKEGGDKRIGKVRIRLSTIESNRIYTHSYPLINLHTQGARKMGEIQLAVRFSCPSLLNVLQTYAQPMFPNMHYTRPLSMFQLDSLRNQAAAITMLKFKRAEPPLSKEVIEYMLDMRGNVWSVRRARAQLYRIQGLINGFISVCKLLKEIRGWKNSVTTVITYLFFLLVVIRPRVILPFIFTILLVRGIWRYRKRPRYPSHMDIKLSHADTTTNEELEEEFDPFPSKFSGDNMKKRYDRLRSLSGKVIEIMGDLASQGERVQSVISWRDPRATTLFLIFCLVVIIGTYLIPVRSLIILWITYLLRPPRLHFDLPTFALNFLRRMPAKSDGML